VPYVNVGLLESLGLISLPNHVSLCGLLVQANPSFELVIGRHVEYWCGVFLGYGSVRGASVKT
jgi:hypothetical protein